MAQIAQCENGHKIKETHRETARRFSRRPDLGRCPTCGAKIQYTVVQKDPATTVERVYDVVRIKALLTTSQAEKEKWDPFIFLLRNQANKRTTMWPYYWKKDRKQRWANGQFPPLLKIEDVEAAIKEFKRL